MINESIIEDHLTENGFDPGVEREVNTATDIKKPFDPKKIDVDTKQPVLYNIIKRLRMTPPEIDLYPDFQRNDNIWNKTKQSQLIESILLRLPLPAFYFDTNDDNKWLVVDGLQRLTTLKNFVVDQSLVLENLEFLTDLNGKKYNELPPGFQRRIEETQIIAYMIRPGTPKDVKFNIFKRINTGGVPMTPQEIRHALNQGKPAEFVAQLSKNSAFIQATGGIKTNRMLDRDFVTRFLSFYITSPREYEPDLDTFLHTGMGKINNLTDIELQQIETNFVRALKTAYAIFGKYAFRKQFQPNQNRKPINKALFETWTVALAKLNQNQHRNLVDQKTEVVKQFIHLLNSDDEFLKSISTNTGHKQMVIKRFFTIESIISKILKQHDKAL